jgi:hypothetical protein
MDDKIILYLDMENEKTVLISGAYLPGIGETIREEFLNMG